VFLSKDSRYYYNLIVLNKDLGFEVDVAAGHGLMFGVCAEDGLYQENQLLRDLLS